MLQNSNGIIHIKGDNIQLLLYNDLSLKDCLTHIYNIYNRNLDHNILKIEGGEKQ